MAWRGKGPLPTDLLRDHIAGVDEVIVAAQRQMETPLISMGSKLGTMGPARQTSGMIFHPRAGAHFPGCLLAARECIGDWAHLRVRYAGCCFRGFSCSCIDELQ